MTAGPALLTCGGMSMQRARRHDPYPWTWELPLGISVAVVMVLVLAAHCGRAIANVADGQPWRFPPRTELFTSLPALLRGDAAAGLQPPTGLPAQGGATGEAVARAGTLWACVAVTEVMALTLLGLLGWQAMARWGPGRLKGMASTADVEQMLGRSRLRANRAIIRPDLYGRRRTPAAPAPPPRATPTTLSDDGLPFPAEASTVGARAGGGRL